MTETKLTTTTPSAIAHKYKNILESAPDVEIITPEDRERGLTPSGKKYEVEFMWMKKVPSSEHEQAIRAWTAMEDTMAEVEPELVPLGLNRGYYKVPLISYRLNDPTYFHQIREGLLFDSKKSDKVLVAYHFSRRQKRRDDLLLQIIGDKSIAFLNSSSSSNPVPQLTAEEAIKEAQMVLHNPQALGPAAAGPDEEESEVLKITAIFLEDEEDEIADQSARSLPTQASGWGSLDQVVGSFISTSDQDKR